MIPMQQNKMRV
ncbi:hypothetical protein SB30_120229 [Klebsiella quasipneumoniae subsp. similipneumoniae]|nr:hypothetical protein SB30_120229 [Klebsiella quasipneumoniae subsp. similipneumoniae]